jgi:putative SOS response-associated peptidase YedK
MTDMCNLYSVTKGQAAIVALIRAMRDRTGNLASMPAVFPDMMAPVVRTAADGIRELAMLRWGFPPPPNLGKAPVTNVRNTKSPYWRGWLKPEFRCLVPATSFCEWTDSRPKVPHWFALDEDRPLFFFAGIWRPWTGERKGQAGEHLLFSFLTCEANEIVRPIHAKAMPVMLTTPEEFEVWLLAPVEEALALQRPLPSEALKIVATGARSDGAEDEASELQREQTRDRGA